MPSRRPRGRGVSVSTEQGSDLPVVSIDLRTASDSQPSVSLELPAGHPDVSVDLRGPDCFVGIHVGDTEAPWLAEAEGLLGATRWEARLKRSADLAFGSLALLMVSPVLLVSSLLIKVSSPGPVFHRQIRVGKGGQRFVLLKFRTMSVDAEERRAELDSANETNGPVFKIRSDPRVTRVGHVLRRLSIDELPQLLHVITGEMSLVGPRPPLPSEVDIYNWWELQRLLVKPGITCIWQVSGRSDLDFETWMRMDLDYIRRWSPTSDLVLLARTVPAVLSGRGAY